MESLTKFIEIFSEAIEAEESLQMTGDTEFRQIADWDSLMIVSLIIMFDVKYGLKVTANEISNCKTIDDLYTLTKGAAEKVE